MFISFIEFVKKVLQISYSTFADIVLVTHALYIFFIVGGMGLILLGTWIGWKWTRNFWFRFLHLAAIFIVALQSWLSVVCPLTTLESFLREKAGQQPYQKTFVAYWLHELLFYEAPIWVFTLLYTLFGLTVVAVWLLIPPLFPWKKNKK